MHAIRWLDGNEMYQVVGEPRSVLSLASILESRKLDFKISDVRGFILDQDDLGCGGFTHWLSREGPFSYDS